MKLPNIFTFWRRSPQNEGNNKYGFKFYKINNNSITDKCNQISDQG